MSVRPDRLGRDRPDYDPDLARNDFQLFDEERVGIFDRPYEPILGPDGEVIVIVDDPFKPHPPIKPPPRDWLPIVIDLTIVILLAVLSCLTAIGIDRLNTPQRIDIQLVPTEQQRQTPSAPPAIET